MILKKKIFFLKKKNKKLNEIINIIGIKNKICLISSYKFTLKKIKLKIIKKQVVIRDPIMIAFLLSRNIFFSTTGKVINPNKINIGNLKNSHKGI